MAGKLIRAAALGITLAWSTCGNMTPVGDKRTNVLDAQPTQVHCDGFITLWRGGYSIGRPPIDVDPTRMWSCDAWWEFPRSVVQSIDIDATVNIQQRAWSTGTQLTTAWAIAYDVDYKNTTLLHSSDNFIGGTIQVGGKQLARLRVHLDVTMMPPYHPISYGEFTLANGGVFITPP